ncbi:helix-turn-helix transcriptional regulator [Pseudonocardia humida]|uniref:Helix-turn-helix domain-containing protein n=1 Tax=Pseudonocardia humida TaxID=2800819 RepID=A0ABT0ZV56_9PSEU|nr:helix-turn-helix domain-containing protein [Pseudonocardia humida]MCO1654543.1 helix-turn-helix domain-containing protein [Pseudonocardia humida]
MDEDGRDAAHAALAAPARRALLRALRDSDRPLELRELAAATGSHPNTVRFHLAALTGAGLVTGRAEASGARGRPRMRYRPAAAPAALGTGYELLAAALAAGWDRADPDPVAAAERTGRATAARLVPSREPEDGSSELAPLVGLLAELGFAPDVPGPPDEGPTEIRLHACPFLSVAAAHPEVVCTLHLGLLRGALDRLGIAATAPELRPFVDPGVCVARIVPTPRGDR